MVEENGVLCRRKSLMCYKLYHIMLYISPLSRFERTTSVMIGTDYIGSSNSYHHTIMATTAIQWLEKMSTLF